MKFTITWGSRVIGKHTWYSWRCSCGEEERYLNETAMKYGAASHGKAHKK